MALIGSDPPGATPLTPEDLEGLLPKHIATKPELNAWEFNNIQKAQERLRGNRPKEVLTDDFARDLHRYMFDETWQWAGVYRTHGTNIGIDWTQISTQTRELFENYRYQREKEVFEPRVHAIRLHRDLVWIHPFPNGNGRHSRLLVDQYLVQEKQQPFTWGGSNLGDEGELRKTYIAALKAADNGDFSPLMTFATLDRP